MSFKNLDQKTKYKLIYSGELAFFSIVFLVFGILFLLGILGNNPSFKTVYQWVTIIGGALLIADFFWGFLSKTRRQRICLLDKAIVLPIAIYNIVIDILLFTNNEFVTNNFRILVTPLFFYLAADYLFQAIYHWYYPIPGLFDDIDKNDDTIETKDDETEVSSSDENKD